MKASRALLVCAWLVSLCLSASASVLIGTAVPVNEAPNSNERFTGQVDLLPGQDSASFSHFIGITGFNTSLTLSTGELHVLATSSADMPAPGYGGAVGDAQAILDGKITIVGDLLAPTTGTISFAVDGTLSSGAFTQSGIKNTGMAFASLGVSTGLGNAVQQTYFAADDCSDIGGVSCTVTQVADTVITLSFTVDDQHRDVFVQSALLATARFGATVDFSNTGKLSVQLAQGLDFVSDTGFLMATVPEGDGLLLVVSGLLALQRLSRRNRTQTVHCRAVRAPAIS